MSIKEINGFQGFAEPFEVSGSKCDTDDLKSKVLQILQKPPAKVNARKLVERATYGDNPDLFDTFDPKTFRGKIK